MRPGCTTHVVRSKRLTLRVVVGSVDGGGWRQRGGGAARQATATAVGGRPQPCYAENRYGRCLTTATAPRPPAGDARRHARRRVRSAPWWILGSAGGGSWCPVPSVSEAGCVADDGPGGAVGWPSSGGWCRCWCWRGLSLPHPCTRRGVGVRGREARSVAFPRSGGWTLERAHALWEAASVVVVTRRRHVCLFQAGTRRQAAGILSHTGSAGGGGRCSGLRKRRP